LIEAWNHYSEFLNSSKEHVANMAFWYLCTHDEAFVAWRRSKYPDARLEDDLDNAERKHAKGSRRRAHGSHAHGPETA
jgi:hypothetical protein